MAIPLKGQERMFEWQGQSVKTTRGSKQSAGTNETGGGRCVKEDVSEAVCSGRACSDRSRSE